MITSPKTQEDTITNDIKAETFKFSAEIDKVFHLMVNALYENKDIFVRELISNASDACDKLRYESNSQSGLLGNDAELKITVELNKEKRLLTISDNGIGMTREELVENLGRIAKSGTQGFLQGLTGDKAKDSQLIGQFGVGFYSAFMVADNVNVISRRAGSDESYIWNSRGDGEYTITKSPENISRGTIITLHIKEGEDTYLDKFRIKSIISSYSDHIAFKIFFKEANGEDIAINDGKALWTRNKSEVSEEEYNEFYKSISALGDDKPWLTLHNKAEGLIEYTNLLYIPSAKPFDLFHPDRLTRIKLYIKRVLISEKLEVIPAYLRFLRGVIDSSDLPLNISRETVQNSVALQRIKTSIVSRVLKELKAKLNKDYESYLGFWQNFGAVLKEGLCEGMEPVNDILECCLFKTSKSSKLISLKEYKENIADGQKAIYYLNAETYDKALASPQIEGFIKKGYEVLILDDSVDDFWVNVVPEYEGLPLKSASRSGSDLDLDRESSTKDSSTDDKNEATKQDSLSDKEQALVEYVKEYLGEQIADCRKTIKLDKSPVCITASENAMDIRLERFMIENKQLAHSIPKVFELNFDHAIIKSLVDKLASNNEDDGKNINQLIDTLFAMANIAEGEPVPDLKAFTTSLNDLIMKSIS